MDVPPNELETLMQSQVSTALMTSVHPRGDPETILSVNQLGTSAEPVQRGDVIVLALTEAQCTDVSEREALLKKCLAAVAPDGIMWIVVPGRWRRTMMHALRAEGMTVGAPTVHNQAPGSCFEFPLTGRGLRFALASGELPRRWWLALAVLERLPWGRAVLLRILPCVGFAAFRPCNKPFEWLTKYLARSDNVDVAIKTNWRGERARYLVFALSDAEKLVAKRGGAACHAAIMEEARLLADLGEAPAEAGLEVPRFVDCITAPRLRSLIETSVPGRPVADLIRGGHLHDFDAIAKRLAIWIDRWNRRTIRQVNLTPALGEALILSAARKLQASLEGGESYLDWLTTEVAALVGQQVPLVAAHNDLTMANVLGDSSGLLSVVDWEAYKPDGLPLADFQYSVCDAASAITGADRAASFSKYFVRTGPQQRQLKSFEMELRAATPGPDAWFVLCMHATWLHHAANEQAGSSSRRDPSFAAIAQMLADSVTRAGRGKLF